MPRYRLFGFIAISIAVLLGALFFYFAFFNVIGFSVADVTLVSHYSFFAIVIPISLVSIGFLGTGFWVGWAILTIKVEPPMPEIVEKKDHSRMKAFFLCVITIALAVFFLYGVSVKSYWALAIPAAAITLVVLGMIFWVGIAIITTRATLPEEKKK